MADEYSGDCPAPKQSDSTDALPPSRQEGSADTDQSSPASPMEGFNPSAYMQRELSYRTEPPPGKT
jgi:hypothetical protein